ncbi:thioredoxin family protein [Oxalobacter aliiformigenes]|uniref:thioredoxin family protein n=1 Tax=Oxalobacter aliiformigenes TaxID=2946593 RepID=UPI0022B04456|nr:thioredoxin family protein [Oxalobacter aliiformigenes]MCZ4065960.1 thioredoxin family protein [Oxalobacter aliiformigenes]WAW00283.1 thioredoxin family protein [Oxalobacter aliiformigenes]
MNILIFGPGCARCHETEKTVETAIRESGRTVTVEKITDFREMARHGILSVPAVVIDGKTVCSGRVPSLKEVTGWLAAQDDTPGS